MNAQHESCVAGGCDIIPLPECSTDGHGRLPVASFEVILQKMASIREVHQGGAPMSPGIANRC